MVTSIQDCFILLFAALTWLRGLLHPLLVPCCFVLAWGLVLMLATQLWSLGRDGLKVSQRLHQIPCTQCRFFTGDYHLKCTVNPSTALTETAIGCRDFNARGLNDLD
jgi:hypothetical protein